MNTKDKRYQKNEQLIRNYFIKMLENNKYSEITINQLCDDILISKNTFYAHFKNKDYLLKTIINELIDDMIENFKLFHPDANSNGVDILRKDFEMIINEIENNKEIFTILFSRDDEINFSNFISFKFKKHTLQWTMYISNSKTSNPKVILLMDFLILGVVNVIKSWLLHFQDIYTKEEILEILWSASQDAVIQVTNLGFNITKY